jgi:isopenicillin-N epimerase
MPATMMTFSPPQPLAADIRSHWTLDPSVAFLNHGSFGAAPREVLAEQSKWRDVLEHEPLHFYDRLARPAMDTALARIGAFIGADPRDLVFVTNATEGCAAVIRSIDLRAGDELITTDHAYPAIINTMRHVAGRAGAKVIEAPIPLPFVDPAAFVAAIDAATNSRTRLVVLDHITSPSALILPVAEVIRACAAKGVPVLIDGAHAPGMIELDIRSLGAAYYTGNLHKWVCAPKGAGFLWVRRDLQASTHPAIISNNYGKDFQTEFAWQGTRDISPWLSTPRAMEFMASFGWDRVRRHNHDLALWAHAMLCERWGVEPISPPDGRSFGSMFTLPLPAGSRTFDDRFECSAALYHEHRVEVPIVEVAGRRMIRPSCQLYNRPADYERLAEAVPAVIGAV